MPVFTPHTSFMQGVKDSLIHVPMIFGPVKLLATSFYKCDSHSFGSAVYNYSYYYAWLLWPQLNFLLQQLYILTLSDAHYQLLFKSVS